MQRAAERKVRAAKKQHLAENAAGLDTTKSAVKLKNARDQLRQFVRDTGGYLGSSRTGTAEFGRSAASKATWVVRNSPIYEARFGGSVSIVPPYKGDAVTHRSVFNALRKNSVGQESIDYTASGKCSVEINYTDDCPSGGRGYSIGSSITIFGTNTKSVQNTASPSSTK
jgi:hypothetical protein